MNVYLARQPILDAHNEVFGYEILYRDGEKNAYSATDGNYASSNVLSRCFFDFSINEITAEKPAFVNFTRDLLVNDVAAMFPKKFLIVEVLENIPADEQTLASCLRLKSLGYTLALDDFALQPELEAFIPYVDIIKVDYSLTTPEQRTEIIKKYRRKGLRFLAEKVETAEVFEQAKSDGYALFQGYYFAKPQMQSRRKEISSLRHNQIRLIAMLNDRNTEPDFAKIAGVVETDLAFSYEILRIANSAWYGTRSKISSVRHALTLLGLEELKKWVYFAFIRDFCKGEPDELIRMCLMRGHFMEAIGLKSGRYDIANELLTIGMFSMIDRLTGRAMDEILTEMNFSDEIKDVLCGGAEGYAAVCLRMALEYEGSAWDDVESQTVALGVTASDLNAAYKETILWLKSMNF